MLGVPGSRKGAHHLVSYDVSVLIGSGAGGTITKEIQSEGALVMKSRCACTCTCFFSIFLFFVILFLLHFVLFFSCVSGGGGRGGTGRVDV